MNDQRLLEALCTDTSSTAEVLGGLGADANLIRVAKPSDTTVATAKPLLAGPTFVLWYRASRGNSWQPVATAPTRAEIVRRIGIGGRKGGDWLIREGETRP